jgi:osmotically inducible protein OsmC
MQFSALLARAQHPADQLKVHAAVTFDKVGEGWKVTTAVLKVRGKVPGVDAATFAETARKAEQLCPIANVIRGNVAVTLDAALG